VNSIPDSFDAGDPGDAVLRKFAYQHAYTVVLLIAMLKNERPYTAVWCEHHEDALGEREDGQFDAYQIKTKKAELGEWMLSDAAMRKSFKRFVAIEEKFPGQIRRYYFVSNVEFLNSRTKRTIQSSPGVLWEEIEGASSFADLSEDGLNALSTLAGDDGPALEKLFEIVNKSELILGPTERAFEAEVCHRHISSIDTCSGLNTEQLRKIYNSLSALVARASQLGSNSPDRDYIGVFGGEESHPILRNKRINGDRATVAIRDALTSQLYYSTLLEDEALMEEFSADRMEQKLRQGGLQFHYEIMRRRSLAAEQSMLDFVTRGADGQALVNEILTVIEGECGDAELQAKTAGDPNYGPSMLIDLQNRVRDHIKQDHARLSNLPYDVLVGVAGLLTSDCKVWWSDRFPLEKEL